MFLLPSFPPLTSGITFVVLLCFPYPEIEKNKGHISWRSSRRWLNLSSPSPKTLKFGIIIVTSKINWPHILCIINQQRKERERRKYKLKETKERQRKSSKIPRHTSFPCSSWRIYSTRLLQESKGKPLELWSSFKPWCFRVDCNADTTQNQF